MFPLLCFCFEVPRPLVQLLNLLHSLSLLLSRAFLYVGLSGGETPLRSQDAPTSSSETVSRIKAQLRVVEFGSLQAAANGRVAAGEEEPACAFCLEALRAREHVRELGNCRHAFHKRCMDRWVDLGHVSCPVCRLDLWPNDEPKKVFKSFWVTFRQHVTNVAHWDKWPISV